MESRKFKNIYFRDSYICECGKRLTSLKDVSFVSRGTQQNPQGSLITIGEKGLRIFVERNYQEIAAQFGQDILRTKVCRYCGNILPSNIGVSRIFKITILGERGCGKTVYTLALQSVLPSLRSSVFAKELERFDLYYESNGSAHDRQRQIMCQEFAQGILPDPTQFQNRDIHLSYKLENRSTSTMASLLLYDMPGEVGNYMFGRNSAVHDADAVFFFLDYHALLDAGRMQYNKKYLGNLMFSKKKKQVPFYIIITQIDESPMFRNGGLEFDGERVENSLVRMENGWFPEANNYGFQREKALKNMNVAKKILADAHSNFYLDVQEAGVSEELIYPFVVSGYDPKDRGCFCVDLPVMHYLARAGLVPYVR